MEYINLFRHVRGSVLLPLRKHYQHYHLIVNLLHRLIQILPDGEACQIQAGAYSNEFVATLPSSLIFNYLLEEF